MQRYFGKKRENDRLYLEHSDYHHIKNVMRMVDGDLIEVVVDNKLYLGCIQNVNDDLEIIVKKIYDLKDEVIPKVNLIIPVLKESKMDLILQKATEMGVYKITVCPLKRCVVKVDDKKVSSKLERWNRILKEASEQSFRSNVPSVEFIRNIDLLKNLVGVKLVCSTRENKNNIKKVLTDNEKCDTINVLIGPEGGLEEYEENNLINNGFESISLGNRIMRVETVPLFILSVINYEFMEW